MTVYAGSRLARESASRILYEAVPRRKAGRVFAWKLRIVTLESAVVRGTEKERIGSSRGGGIELVETSSF